MTQLTKRSKETMKTRYIFDFKADSIKKYSNFWSRYLDIDMISNHNFNNTMSYNHMAKQFEKTGSRL